MPDIPLKGGFQPIEIAPGGFTLQAPGLIGHVRQQTNEERTTRGDSGVYEQSFQAAVAHSDISAASVFEIVVDVDNTPVADGEHRADGMTATTREGEPAMIFSMPRLGDAIGYAVCYTGADGVSRWVFPHHIDVDDDDTRGGGQGKVVFHMPRATVGTADPDSGETEKRGPWVAVGRALLRPLFWATDQLIGQPALAVATILEQPKHPYAFRAIQPDRFQFPNPQSDAVDWTALQAGRALLFLHGTFSTAEASFAQLSPHTLEQLAAHYGNRLFAFNHPSVYHAPVDNIDNFIQLLPRGTKLDLDIVTHSRGGLVGRELSERWRDHDAAARGVEIKVNKAVLVASPNSGTRLVDADHDTDLLNRYTNLLVGLPDTATTLILEGILMAVQILGHGVLLALPGLRCFHPSLSNFLGPLNALPPSATQYFAIGSDFTPTEANLSGSFFHVVDGKLVDDIFDEANDAVVPSKGSYMGVAENAPGFQIPDAQHVILNDKDQPVWHITYFQSPVVNQQLLDWLTT